MDFRDLYPIGAVLPQLADCLRQQTIAILSSPPGSGKTTIVPLAILSEEWTAGRKIFVVQPRRLAARTVAERMAELLQEKIGETVGYRIRHNSVVGAHTRVEVMTEGILIRKLQYDPELSDCAMIIFDEFHERSLQSDLALAFARDIQSTLRPDLRLVLMSATISGQLLPLSYGSVATIMGGARVYPVEIIHHAGPTERGLAAAAVSGLRRAYLETDRDILVFLPGVPEIKKTAELFRAQAPTDVQIFELYGDLPYADQKRAILPDTNGRRKVILSTPIAETSITIENITAVVDSGWEKVSRFDPGRGANSLELRRITQDSADQRAGRAGRLAPGKCFRLFQGELIRSREPEILRADLAPLALELAAWGVRDSRSLAWIDRPPEGAMLQAIALLRRLSLLDSEGVISERGKRVARLPTHPRLGAMLLAASGGPSASAACELAALLEERDFGPNRSANIEERFEMLHGAGRGATMRRSAIDRVRQTSRQLAQTLGGIEEKSRDLRSVGELLSYAYPDRIAMRRTEAASDTRYLLVSGGAARFSAPSSLSRAKFLVVADLRLKGADAEIALAAEISERELRTRFAAEIAKDRVLEWDAQANAVTAECVERLGALVLSRQPISDLSPQEKAETLLRGMRSSGGLSVLCWNDEALDLRTRMTLLEKYYPELELPSVSDQVLYDSLEHWLLPHLEGLSRLSQLAEVRLTQPLLDRYSWEQRKHLDKCTPISVNLPTGKVRRLEFDSENGIVLSATVQELFGWRELPPIGEGRIPLMLHVLSPARRPIQVTKDLKSFWLNTYQQVRKELRGRYPKHKWPEDPLAGF